MTKWTDQDKQNVLDLFKKFGSQAQVCRITGVPYSTVGEWVNQDIKNRDNPQREFQSLSQSNEEEFKKQRDRIVKELAEGNDVTLYGKPPTGRSALEQKKKEQASESQRHSYSISQYYRGPPSRLR